MHKKFLPFIPDVMALKLSNPIAVIARRTGDDLSNVSAYIRGVKRPGNAFLVRFYTAFEKELAVVGIKRDVNMFIRITPHKKRTTKESLWRSIARKLDRKIELLEKIEIEIAQQRKEQKQLRKDIERTEKKITLIHNLSLLRRARPSYN